jgi:hypothetical protein
MSDPNYLYFQNFCASLNENTIMDFKKNREIMGIIENVNIEFGNLYLKNIMKYKESESINWENIKKFNDTGNPSLRSFLINNNEILLSPTTLRYIQFSLDMLSYIKNDLNLSNVDIVEVGGGYGFQCILFFELAQLFSINVDSYTIIDLPEAGNMQLQYISKCKKYFSSDYFDKISFVSFYDISSIIDKMSSMNNKPNTFFVSNYALGEFNKQIQDYYINNVVSYLKHGYICWNFSPNNKEIHPYILNLNPIINEENPQTNCYPVKSYIVKF